MCIFGWSMNPLAAKACQGPIQPKLSSMNDNLFQMDYEKNSIIRFSPIILW